MNAPLIEQYVLITGSPVTGFTLTGPFDTRGQAADYAVLHINTRVPWWVAPLFNPKE